MGYESRIYVMNRMENKESGYVGACEIAQFEMCKMGYDSGFYELFTTPIDFDLVVVDDFTREDCYGDHCKSASVKTVAAWLREELKRSDYRRLKPLLGFLEAIDEEQWNDIRVVHFGC